MLERLMNPERAYGGAQYVKLREQLFDTCIRQGNTMLPDASASR